MYVCIFGRTQEQGNDEAIKSTLPSCARQVSTYSNVLLLVERSVQTRDHGWMGIKFGGGGGGAKRIKE